MKRYWLVAAMVLALGCDPAAETYHECDHVAADAKVTAANLNAAKKLCLAENPVVDPDLNAAVYRCVDDTEHSAIDRFALVHEMDYHDAAECVLMDPRAEF
jgi:hypothetical protein